MHPEARRRTLFALFILVAILAILYLRGTLDPVLYRFGLNHNPCTRDAAGHITCGSNVTGTPYGWRPGVVRAPGARDQLAPA